MMFNFLLKSPLLIGVVYSPWRVILDTYSESFIVWHNTDDSGETTSARFSIILALMVR